MSSGGYYLSSDKFYGLKVLDGSLCFCCVAAERDLEMLQGAKNSCPLHLYTSFEDKQIPGANESNDTHAHKEIKTRRPWFLFSHLLDFLLDS